MGRFIGLTEEHESLLKGDHSLVSLDTLQYEERRSTAFWRSHQQLREAYHSCATQDEIYRLVAQMMGVSQGISIALIAATGG